MYMSHSCRLIVFSWLLEYLEPLTEIFSSERKMARRGKNNLLNGRKKLRKINDFQLRNDPKPVRMGQVFSWNQIRRGTSTARTHVSERTKLIHSKAQVWTWVRGSFKNGTWQSDLRKVITLLKNESSISCPKRSPRQKNPPLHSHGEWDLSKPQLSQPFHQRIQI